MSQWRLNQKYESLSAVLCCCRGDLLGREVPHGSGVPRSRRGNSGVCRSRTSCLVGITRLGQIVRAHCKCGIGVSYSIRCSGPRILFRSIRTNVPRRTGVSAETNLPKGSIVGHGIRDRTEERRRRTGGRVCVCVAIGCEGRHAAVASGHVGMRRDRVFRRRWYVPFRALHLGHGGL